MIHQKARRSIRLFLLSRSAPNRRVFVFSATISGMLWVDKVVEDIKERLASQMDAGRIVVVRDEKTASGRVHVGSMRGVAIHATVAEALRQAGVEATFLYEINDTDPMDGLPVYLDEEKYKPEMGKPLNKVVAPSAGFENFAEEYGQEFEKVITDVGYHPSFYRASRIYSEGRMNDVIKIALDNADKIRAIYKEVSGSIKPDDWYPISIVCENCGKVGTTRASTWDGNLVTYKCEENMVKWAKGCGHEGQTSPYDGRATLPWKVEWPAKWRVMNVSVEGAGKDHSTKGGAREVANRISKEVFIYQPPVDIPYEFFLVGGQKMSSSKGRGSSAREIADFFPPLLFRLLLTGTPPMRAVNIDPEGETLPTMFDWHDKIAEKYWSGEKDDDSRLFEVIHHYEPPEKYFLARFSSVAFLAQMPHVDIFEEFTKIKGSSLTQLEMDSIENRKSYAHSWLSEYAPERYKFEIQKTLPDEAKQFSDTQRQALAAIYRLLLEKQDITGEDLHAALHDIRKESGLEAKDFFGAIYKSILGKDSGPQAGWFLTTLDRDFLIARLNEVSK